MNSKLAAVLGAGVAVAAAVPALTSAQAPAPTNFAQSTFVLTEADTNDFAFLDHPPKTKFGRQGPRKISNGDQLVFRSKLLDAAKTRVGALDATCMITGAGNGRFTQANAICHATFTVPGGQLFAQVGGKPFSGTTSGGITGGTGNYEGATGSFTSVGEESSKDTFHVWVPVK
jgi:hypothetical protein